MNFSSLFLSLALVPALLLSLLLSLSLSPPPHIPTLTLLYMYQTSTGFYEMAARMGNKSADQATLLVY